MTTLKALKISCQFAAVAWLSSWYYSYELERERQTRSLQQLPSLRQNIFQNKFSSLAFCMSLCHQHTFLSLASKTLDVRQSWYSQ